MIEAVALGVALGSVVVSAASFAYSVVAARREQRDRREELDLLRRQVEGEMQHRIETRRARLIGRQGSISGGEARDSFTIGVLNAGPDVARDVRCWAVDENGNVLSGPQHLGGLPPGADQPREFRLEISREFSRGQRQLFLRSAWMDGTGEREENIMELKPL